MLDIRVKERLTGAIILVALLVLLVPELLTGPSRSASPAEPPPSTEDAQLRSYTIDLGEDTAPHSVNGDTSVTPNVEAKPAESAEDQSGTRAEPPPSDAPVVNAAPQSTPAVPPAPTEVEKPPAAKRASSEPPKRVASAETRPTSGWAWQVGSFASRENAERLTRELKGKGFAATVSESTSKGKRLWRVRVGPEADRAGAVALGAKLRAAGQPGGAAVPWP
jgi:DedD protein